MLVKRILRKYGYPPDKQEKATQTVLEQAEVLVGNVGGGMTAARGSGSDMTIDLLEPAALLEAIEGHAKWGRCLT